MGPQSSSAMNLDVVTRVNARSRGPRLGAGEETRDDAYPASQPPALLGGRNVRRADPGRRAAVAGRVDPGTPTACCRAGHYWTELGTVQGLLLVAAAERRYQPVGLHPAAPAAG